MASILLILAVTANINLTGILEINKTFSYESFKGKCYIPYRKGRKYGRREDKKRKNKFRP